MLKVVFFLLYAFNNGFPKEHIILENPDIIISMSLIEMEVRSDCIEPENLIHWIDGIIPFDCQYMKISLIQNGKTYKVKDIDYKRNPTFYELKNQVKNR